MTKGRLSSCEKHRVAGGGCVPLEAVFSLDSAPLVELRYRYAGCAPHLDHGLYEPQLRRWLEFFQPSQLLLVSFAVLAGERVRACALA